jgi:hypothetical protein
LIIEKPTPISKVKKKIKEKAHNSLSALTILIEDISLTPTQNSHHKKYKLKWSDLEFFNYEKTDQIFICSNTIDKTKNKLHRLLP